MKLQDAVCVCLNKYNNFYLYDESIIDENIRCLQTHFPQVHFLYSVKCNNNPHVMQSVFSHGFGADAASMGEVRLAQQAGLLPNEIYYSAPGKSVEDIKSAIGKANIIADSLNEIQQIQAIAASTGTVIKIGMRINPDFTFAGAGGLPSKFGIDEEQALVFLQKNACPNIKVTGIHVHVKSQELNAAALLHYYKQMLNLAEKFEGVCGELEYINMGSGIGIQYSPDDEPLDISTLGTAAGREFAAYKKRHPHTQIIIEVGRYAVCKSGVYVTTVLDRKVSRGKTYLILKNTLNGFLRPSLAQLIAQYASEEFPAGSEPLFTAKNACEIMTLKADAPSETVTLVGNLCTNTDVVAENICLPHLDKGDAVIITNAGSYAYVLSPMQFSSQEKPVELFLSQSGEIV